MTQVYMAKDTVISRISGIVDKLMQGEDLFRERLDKNEVMQIFSSLLERVSPEKLLSLDDSELTARVDRVMVREAVAGTLNQLTPEQMKIFDAAVEGR
ncbi:MAG: hypothetical protein GDA43_02085 [Hormoscilla sp. SP5CHS1]|nr:hypothetical protein [Hormoscilla sp. SP12CHS1]MBC6452122.1 hypothetical protein [Hormoscilla sp. SP5CHS1]